MVCTQLRILRVFGLTSAEVTAILRQAQADGCTGLRLLERDGEVCRLRAGVRPHPGHGRCPL